jgi:hypothetical protein
MDRKFGIPSIDKRAGSVLVLNFDAHKVPVFKEEKNKDWIIYGNDGAWKNRYCDYLLQLFNRSAKHNALITAKAHYIAGNGFEIDETGLRLEEKARLYALVKRANKFEETLEDIEYKCALDVEIFGGYYKEIVWNKAGTDFDIYHCDWTKLRRSKDQDGYWYSENWAAKKQSEESVEDGGTGLRFIPDFDPENPKESQIYTYIEYRPGVKYYPLPGYIGAIPYAEIDYEISNFHLNNIKSGFNAGTIINFSNGRPTDEEKETIETKLKEKFVGTDRAGSLLITFSNGRDSAPTIEHLTPSDLDKQFEILNTTTQQELFIGHRITSPMLFGVRVEGQLGGRDEIIEAYELFKKTYICQKQSNLDRANNYLLAKKGINGKLKLKETQPITERPSEAELIKVMTNAEIRERAGLPALENDTSNKVTDALSTISPLVATKVLETMTADEIRALVGLGPAPVEDKPVPMVSSAVHHFNSDQDEKDVEIFLQFGESKNDYEIMRTFDSEFVSQKECFEAELKMLDRNILDLLKKNPLASADELAKALKTKPETVSQVIKKLVTDGLLTESKSGLTPSSEGNKIIKDNKPSTSGLQIMYSYELRTGVKGPAIIETTRPFCKKLYESNKLFSRQDIETISDRVGYDVWAMRGGWYTKPGTNERYPFCRHVFKQHIVRKK